MLALDEYEHSLCPQCGMPLSVCHDEQTPFHFTADVGICQISLMQSLKLDEGKKDHVDENELKHSALTVGMKPR